MKYGGKRLINDNQNLDRLKNRYVFNHDAFINYRLATEHVNQQIQEKRAS